MQEIRQEVISGLGQMEIARQPDQPFVMVIAEERIVGIEEPKSFRPRRSRQLAVCLNTSRKQAHVDRVASRG